MIKIFTASLFTICFIFNLSAQLPTKTERYKPNIIYPELGGNGLLYSLNYERIIKQVGSRFFSMRIGYGIIPTNHSGGVEQTLPLELIWVDGIKHHLEYGIGFTTVLGYSSYSAHPVSIIPAPRVGYRYQAPNSNLMVRAGVALLFTNHYNQASSPSFYPSIAIGVAL